MDTGILPQAPRASVSPAPSVNRPLTNCVIGQYPQAGFGKDSTSYEPSMVPIPEDEDDQSDNFDFDPRIISDTSQTPHSVYQEAPHSQP